MAAYPDRMRNTLTLALMCSTLVGCATELDGDPETATSQSNMLCGSFCDPADPMDVAAALDLVGLYIGATFPNSRAVAPPTCANLGNAREVDYECIQQIFIRQSACGPVAVSCYRYHCDYKILNYCR